MDPKRMGQTLRSLRGAKKVADVANALGISRSALVMYERGDRVPRDEVKIRIAQYYGQPIQNLFFAQ